MNLYLNDGVFSLQVFHVVFHVHFYFQCFEGFEERIDGVLESVIEGVDFVYFVDFVLN